jgi:large subunit ribosomal protein L10
LRSISHLWERGYKLKKEKKEAIIAKCREDFDRAKAVIFTDYRGMTVAELSELRRLLREGRIKYRIVKNTLARIASQDTPVSVGKDSLKGPVGVVTSYDDPVLAAKKVLEYSKKNEKLKISSGIIEGRVCGSDDIRAIAELPSRKVLLSMVAGIFRAPLGKLAAAFGATINSFGYAIEALKQQKSKVES